MVPAPGQVESERASRAPAGVEADHRVSLVYDGLCAFCIRSLRPLQAIDFRGRLVLHDATDRAAVLERFPQLAEEDLDTAMYVVDAAGRSYRGFYAFRRIARALPLLWPLVPLVHLPGAGFVGERVYALIARNRSQLGCRLDPPADA